MKTSEAFKACIPLIESGNFSFICHAIAFLYFGNAYEDWFQDTEDHSVIPEIKIVEDLLGVFETFDEFVYELRKFLLAVLLRDEQKSAGYFPTDEESKELRLIWLNSLVAEYEAKGE